MCSNNQFWPHGKVDPETIDYFQELFEAYDRNLDWLNEEVLFQEDPDLMKQIRRAHYKLPLNL